MNPEIKKYIEKRYNRWLDYASYHCSINKMADEAADVLNEVIVSLLEKEEEKVLTMYGTKKNGYRELDFFVLRMIKLNVYSHTSPYRNKYKKCQTADIELSRLNIPDEEYIEDDKPARLLAQLNHVRDVYEKLQLSGNAKKIFEFRFFNDNKFSEWKGPESKKELYIIYNKIVKLIKHKIGKRILL